ncbi:UV radiation resistance-associated protein [Halotydeus destructor]|nr:UV radiation resistance-associated protein [Halotydeus destructor]
MALFNPAASKESYSASTLCRIKVLQSVINQTESGNAKSSKKIEVYLERSLASRDLEHQSEKLRMRISLLKREIDHRRDAIKRLQISGDDIKSLLSDKLTEMSNCFQQLKHDRENYVKGKRRLEDEKEKLNKVRSQLYVRRKQLISEITLIFPIAPHPKYQGDFLICGVHLPDSEKLSNTDEVAVSVTLGYVCHILVILSKILDVPLRYSLIFAGSRSSIYDHLHSTLSEADRTLPLYSKKSGKDKVYFDYAVYLLNHVIGQLQHYMSRHPKNLSRTLPNLHSLLSNRLSIVDDGDNLRSSSR